MTSHTIPLAILVLAMAFSACDKKLTDTDKTAVIFKPSLSTQGITWRDGDQLLITYSTDAVSSLTTCYQYKSAENQWTPVSGGNILYAEDVKNVSQIEGFGQSSNLPTGTIYSGQSLKDNYLCTRHLLCATPVLNSDKRILEAPMDSRAVHIVLKLTGEVPEEATVTLAGEVAVKTYKTIGDSFVMFAAHLKLWHLPGITMSEDNNVGTVAPGSLFATVDYIDKEGIKKTLRINYSIMNNMNLIRGNQIFLVVTFQDTDVLETFATVSTDWINPAE